MKRFVTYLYECERGNKSRNVGFIRVNVRGEETTLEVYIRNVMREHDEGKLFLLIYEGKLKGVEIGELEIKNGQCDKWIQISTTNINGCSFSLRDIEGVGICFHSGNYIASCWKDEYAEEIARGEFSAKNLHEKKETVKEEQALVVAEEKDVLIETSNQKEKTAASESIASYEKIDLSQIRELPSPNWHLATNSFLVHGFWNYGYLVLKKEVETDKEKLSLGVPGIFEKPEAVMALLFGFPTFEAVSQEMTILEKEKNQESKVGTMGCWFVDLKM